jgi:hypothetical protein
VGHLETFKLEWEKKIVETFPLLAHFGFNLKTGDHHTAVNHPSNKGGTKKKDPQKTRYFYKKLLKTEKNALRAICRMVLIDYICFPEYPLPLECSDMEMDILEARQLLLVKKIDI